MKKTLVTTTFIFCSILVGSCGNSGNTISQNNQPNPENTAIANQSNSESNSAKKAKLDNQEHQKQTNPSVSSEQTPIKNDNPTFGTIKDMQNGDLKCYVTLVDRNGKLYESVGATFDVCEPDKYVNKNVQISYELEDVNDCQSAEPCGKTIKEWLINKIEIRDEKSQN
ncbi:hypothetical protein FACHB389_18435 [Nostoc calcicola FACHB-389]|nr:hypothetical protein [Nostoc calcicola FACHB-3891]OKH33202.1 hypothetical protein FACHB389_18435 [Nostoc calcicola FACHB-389]